MRRKDREVKNFAQIREIIEECDVIRLGFNDGEFPYIIPLNYGCEIEGEDIYFYIHGAKVGHKADLIKENGKCSFEMDGAHKLELLYEHKDVTMRYKSLMGTAKIEIIEDAAEKERCLDILMDKHEDTRTFEYDHAAISHTMVAKLTVLSYTGKINPVGGNAD